MAEKKNKLDTKLDQYRKEDNESKMELGYFKPGFDK